MLILIGPACSGKNYLRSKLLEIGFFSVISTTTRVKRLDEVEGIHYNFKSRQEFEKLINEDAFIEYDEFNGEYYGIERKNMKKEFYSIAILTCRGLKKILSDDMIIIYLNVSAYIRRERMIKERNYSYQQIDKRIRSDENLLNDLPSNIDCVIEDPYFTLKHIAQFTSRVSINLDATNNNIFKWFGLNQEAINEINESRRIYPVGKSNRFLLSDFLIVKCDRKKVIPTIGKVLKELVAIGFHYSFALEYVTKFEFIHTAKSIYEFIMNIFDVRTSNGNNDKVDSSSWCCCLIKHKPNSYSYLK
jgi:guanylate kinase